jgi:hypothetical protein
MKKTKAAKKLNNKILEWLEHEIDYTENEIMDMEGRLSELKQALDKYKSTGVLSMDIREELKLYYPEVLKKNKR